MRIRLGSLLTLGFALIAFQILTVSVAHAQTVPASITLNLTLPTQNTDGTAIPATGQSSLAKVQVWLSTATIPTTASTPTVEATPVVTTIVQPFSAAIGDKIFARVKVCNVAGSCSAMSVEVSKSVPVPQPGAPTSVTFTIAIGP